MLQSEFQGESRVRENLTHGLVCDVKGRRRAASAPFTLIELLVVIAIVTILASLLMPALQKVRESAHLAVCINNERQLAIASNDYTKDNRGRFPYGSQDFNGETKWGVVRWRDDSIPRKRFLHQIWGLSLGKVDSWAADWLIRPPGKYLADYNVFFCPGHLKRGYKEFSMLMFLPNMELVFGLEGNPKPNDSGAQRNIQISYIVFQGGYDTPDADGYRVPNRIVAGKQPLTDSSDPLCWLYADKYRVNGLTSGPFLIENLSHHHGLFNTLTMPFNVAHIDCHVDTHQWNPAFQGWGIRRFYAPYDGLDTDDDRR
jgi:prepilin-type N-terminal cleavage/methylation domain-containing protein